MKKYVCYGQHVTDSNKNIKFVSARMVMESFGLYIKDCILVDYERDYDEDYLKSLTELYPNMIEKNGGDLK